jgi:hypothetical protein
VIEARYDLAFEIAGHDFYSWLVVAAARGARQIVFGIDRPKENKWAAETVLRRFQSIIEPGPALAGLPYRLGAGGTLGMSSPHMLDLVAYCQRNGTAFRRLSSVLPRGTAQFTVTLRREGRVPVMNSNEGAWRRFAEAIGAVVIADYDDAPLHLHRKLALYAGAEMNFGVVNGPMHLLTLTHCPVTIFKANVSASNLKKHGIPTGSQLPWAGPGQRLVWEDDDYDNLMRHFDAQHAAAA